MVFVVASWGILVLNASDPAKLKRFAWANHREAWRTDVHFSRHDGKFFTDGYQQVGMACVAVSPGGKHLIANTHKGCRHFGSPISQTN